MCDEGGRDSEEIEGLVMVARHSSSDTAADAASPPCTDLITFERDDPAKQQQFEGGEFENHPSTEAKASTKAIATTADVTQSQTAASDNVIRTRVIKRLGPEDRQYPVSLNRPSLKWPREPRRKALASPLGFPFLAVPPIDETSSPPSETCSPQHTTCTDCLHLALTC